MSEVFGREQIDRIVTYLETHQRFLFDKYGFEIAHTSTGGRYNTEPIVGLSNGRLQFLTHETGSTPPRVTCPGIPYVGKEDESRENERILVKYWLPSIWVFYFLDGDSPSGDLLDREIREQVIEATWYKLETRIPELEGLFRSEATMREWMPDYLRFTMVHGGVLTPSKQEWLEEDPTT